MDKERQSKFQVNNEKTIIFRTLYLKNAFSNLAKVMLDMLFHLVAFSYMQYSQSYEASKRRGETLKNGCEPP